MAVVDVMLWLYIVLVIVAIGLLLFGLRRGKPTTDRATQRAAIGLYAIRRRLEVAQFRTELHRDAASLRRSLRDELQEDTRYRR